MTTGTIELLQRVGGLVEEHKEFFDTVTEWYGNIKLTAKLARSLLGRKVAGAKVALIVNNRTRPGFVTVVPSHAPTLSWLVPAEDLVAGDNRVVVHLEKTPGPALRVKAAGAAQEKGRLRQTLDLTVANPPCTGRLDLVRATEARHTDDCWRVREGGSLVLLLHLEWNTPVQFSLTLPGEYAELFKNLKEALKKIVDKVKERLGQLEEKLREVRKTNPAQAAKVMQDIDALETYLYLHKKQIAPALLAEDGVTLEQVIERTGQPDRLIKEFLRQAAVVPAAPAPAAAPPPMPAPSAPPAAVTFPRRPRPRGKGVFTCLTVLVVLVALVAGGLYAAWVFLVPQPSVRFDSLTEGQTVPAGAPLQVWVAAEDLFGVKSLTLTVDGSNLVDGQASPPEFTFPEGPDRTGSKVFVVNLKPYDGAEARTLTLMATVVNLVGKTVTSKRVVKVGGPGKALVLSIDPVNPRPKQWVNVTVRAVNLPPGTVVKCKVRGTDNWKQDPVLTIGADGTARFGVPGSSYAGVQDVIDAWVEGTDVRQKVSYEF
jgi:hypothetical protein